MNHKIKCLSLSCQHGHPAKQRGTLQEEIFEKSNRLPNKNRMDKVVALILCLVSIMTFSMCSSRSSVPVIEGDEVNNIFMDSIDRIVFAEKKIDGIKISNYKGFVVAERDTAVNPMLMTASDWIPLLDYAVNDRELTVSVNYESINKRYFADKNNTIGSKRIKSKDYRVATLIVPKGMIKKVTADGITVYFDSVRSNIEANVNGRIVLLNGSRIDTLRCSADNVKELKMTDSNIKSMYIRSIGKMLYTISDDSKISEILIRDSI